MTDTSPAAIPADEPVGGYHPGGYCNFCVTCGGQFIGAKRCLTCRGCAVAALADLAAGGWRTMDSAPKDGTRVLTYSPGAVALGFRAIRVNWFEDGLWQHTNAQHWPPTHWRPLPAPPMENDDG